MTAEKPHLFLLGVSHHTAELELRERLSLSTEKAAALEAELRTIRSIYEFTVLNTCNRIEIYGAAASPQGPDDIVDAFCRVQGVDRGLVDSVQEQFQGVKAIEHLFSVAAGLDSQMLGETEIMGQVKSAYADASRQKHVGPILNRVFQKAFQTAKYVRTHTAIGEGQTSIASVSVELAAKMFGDLSSARVLVIGAGDIGEKTVRAFISRGATQITIASRTESKAAELARQLGGEAISLDRLSSVLPTSDVIVCSTAAPVHIISKELAASALRARPARPLFFVDLAMPRDVDPGIADLPNVFLYNLDDLARIAEQNRAVREAELVRCREMIAERAAVVWKHLYPGHDPSEKSDRSLHVAPGSVTDNTKTVA